MAESIREPTSQSIASDPVEVGVPQSLARAVLSRRSEYLRPSQIRVKVGTWNVAACTGTDKDLASWFTEDAELGNGLSALDISDVAPSSEPRRLGNNVGFDLYVLGLQEVVDLNQTREYMNRIYADNGPMEKWTAALEAAIPQGYQLVVSEQMTGLLLLIYASPTIAPTISNVSTQQVGTGLLGYFGNKGAVATRLVLGETTKLLFVNCHLASGADSASLNRRCWDVGQIVSKTQFDPVVISGVSDDDGDRIGDEDFAFWFGDMNFRLDGLPGDDIRRLLTLHARGEYDLSNDKPPPIEGGDGIIVMRSSESDDETTTMSSMHSRDHSFDQSFDSESSLPDPDDFPEDPSQDPASLQATIDSLLPHDQLRRVIKQHKLFHDGWREGSISFLPTFKYDVGTFGLFDTSEKQRAPSWCDRVLYRTRKDKEAYEKIVEELKEAKMKDDEMRARGIEEDDDVLFSYDPDTDGEEQPPKAASSEAYDEYEEYDINDTGEEAGDGDQDQISLDLYTSHQRITSSDHKPVTSIFTLRYDAVDPEKKAKIHSEIAFELDRAENEGRPGVTLIVEGGHGQTDGVVDFGYVGFFETHSCSITIANTSSAAASFEFLHETQTSEDDMGSSQWLKTSFHRPDEDGSKSKLGSSVTLEPGETILAIVEARVCEIPHVRALNDASCKLDGVLVLRVEGGKDHFVPVHGTWLPSCFGRSIDELIRVPEYGIRKFVKEKGIQGTITYDWDVHCSAPRELFKLTEAIQTAAERCIADEAMLEDLNVPRDPGWPLDAATWTVEAKLDELKAALISALDTNSPLADALPVELLSTQKLEVYSAILLLFLESLMDGLIPPHLWAKLSIELPNLTTLPVASWPDVKNHILDLLSMSPSHNIAFVFLTATLSRVVGELNPATQPSPALGALTRRLSFRPGETEAARKRRVRERRYAEIVSPLLFRTSDDKDKTKKDRERVVLEMFLKKDDRS